jgi:AraC family transcriptional regulator
MPIAEIALAVGFADQAHFTRRFRMHVGQTPGTYSREQATPSASRQ